MTRRNLLVPLILVVLAGVAAVLGSVLTDTKPVLGLDLQGGFSVVLQAKEVNGRLPPEESVEKAKDIIRQRVDGLGVAEPDITRQGRTVIVQLPGVKNRNKAESLVGCTAKLEFRPVQSLGPNPNAPGPKTTTTTAKGNKASTTTKPKGTTTTGSGDQTSTTAGATTTSGSGSGETGSGVVGLGNGEDALPAQLAPTTTAPPSTTAPPETVPPTTAPTGSTAPGETTTAPGASTTAPSGDTSTTVAPGGSNGSGSSSCGGVTSTPAKGSSSTTTTAPATPGSIVAPSDDGQFLYTLGPVGFTGEALSSANAALARAGGWEVNVSIKGSQQDTANAAFNACATGGATCPGGQGAPGAIAIVLDGKVISAPRVNSQDLASQPFQITGSFSQSEAKNLALVLRYGSLPVEFEQAALQQVSATLGQDSLHAGLVAGLIGIAAVALYMLLYYRGLGLVVIIGLGVWGGLMYGLVCYLGQAQGLALTLSGITGIIVSVGTTVDSYVVYFERLKDEVRGGRSVRSSTERGFASAFRTILTADVSSFIGAFLLWYLTVGPVRGFAFFLGISVMLDLLVAYTFTRPLVILLGRSKRFTNARFLGLASALDRAPATVTGAPA